MADKITFPSSPPQSTTRQRKVSHRASLVKLELPQEDVQETKQESSSWSWLGLSRSEWDILALSTALKLLLFPAYRSTDFEVHRNWLAITHSLPISKWYFDTTSEWTLDYPPFFAYFEWLLSFPARLIDKNIIDVNNLNYGAWTVVVYQRLTVIVTELVLGAAVLRFTRGAVESNIQRVISTSLFLHPGFLIIDHIHFQYNGFMFGILLWSILMARNGDKLGCGFFFAVLLNFKHIYMYQAPAYFIYLLRSFCMSPQGDILLPKFLSLANIVIAVFVVSIGPFFLMGQLPQLLSRLFPFKRGLNHAYWAPNAWALVTAADRVLLKVAKFTSANLRVNEAGVASSSRGLVGDTVFAVLPNVKPIHTFLITIAFQSIFLVKLWRTPTYKSFLIALTLTGYVSYMFGWHVHEKAILLVLVPLSLLATENNNFYRTYIIASVAGIYSLFPLLFTPAESFVKVAYSVLWMFLTFRPLTRRMYEFPQTLIGVVTEQLERLYLVGFILLHAIVTVFPLFTNRADIPIDVSNNGTVPCITTNDTACPSSPDAFPQRDVPSADTSRLSGSGMEFLPLMATSVYCAIGLTWAFLRLSYLYLRAPPASLA